MAIEQTDTEYLHSLVAVDLASTTVQAILDRLLPPTSPYTVKQDGPVVLLQPRTHPNFSWPDYILTRFTAERTFLMNANNGLAMHVYFQRHPGAKGIAGHFSPGDINNLVGPFDERNITLRQGLNLLLIHSRHGGMWLMPNNGVWTLLDYGEPARSLP